MGVRIPLIATVAALAVAAAAVASGSQRANVHFASAPLGPKSAFASIARRYPRVVLTARARRVALIQWNGERPLLVAPTTGGGFCESLAGAYGGTGCFPGSARARNKLNSGLVGDTGGPVAFNGTFFDPRAVRLAVRYEDGRTSVIPVIWVDAPIRAGFFVYVIPSAHRHAGHRPLTIALYSAKGAQLIDLSLVRR
jgi:hypothetical protein